MKSGLISTLGWVVLIMLAILALVGVRGSIQPTVAYSISPPVTPPIVHGVDFSDVSNEEICDDILDVNAVRQLLRRSCQLDAAIGKKQYIDKIKSQREPDFSPINTQARQFMCQPEFETLVLKQHSAPDFESVLLSNPKFTLANSLQLMQDLAVPGLAQKYERLLRDESESLHRRQDAALAWQNILETSNENAYRNCSISPEEREKINASVSSIAASQVWAGSDGRCCDTLKDR